MACPVIVHTYFNDSPFNFYYGVSINSIDEKTNEVVVFDGSSIHIQHIRHFDDRNSAHYFAYFYEKQKLLDDVKGEFREKEYRERLEVLFRGVFD